MKTCNRCKEDKPYTEYHRMTKSSDGYQYTCKGCVSSLEKTRKEYHKKKMQKKRKCPDYRIMEAANKRDYRLQWSYGINEKDYLEILEEQNYCCKICGVHEKELYKRLSVDHNHETHKVRGLLCDACNRGLGLFKDNPDMLKKAAKYLKKEGFYG